MIQPRVHSVKEKNFYLKETGKGHIRGNIWTQLNRSSRKKPGGRNRTHKDMVTHEPQHARSPCPSPTQRAYPTQTIELVMPSSSCPQSFQASGSFQMSQLFASGVQIIGVSASTSDLPMNTQDWSPLGWTGWISLQSRKLSRVLSNTTVQKHQFFGVQLSL